MSPSFRRRARLGGRFIDPAEGAWHDSSALSTPRFLHTATLLGDGRVLVAGGANAAEEQIVTTEIFDPADETWSPGPALAEARVFHAAAALPDGGALVVAGKLANIKFLATSERLTRRPGRLRHGPSAARVTHRPRARGPLVGPAAGHGRPARQHHRLQPSERRPALRSRSRHLERDRQPRDPASPPHLDHPLTGEVLIIDRLGSASVLDSAELAVPWSRARSTTCEDGRGGRVREGSPYGDPRMDRTEERFAVDASIRHTWMTARACRTCSASRAIEGPRIIPAQNELLLQLV
ncbi:MAG: hypothetical protein IPG04_10070 [Polyangiaceae bacterium]|nr:hypothetical protein [Polyangiaceae bacterium]